MSEVFGSGQGVPGQIFQWLKSYFPGQPGWQSELENSGLPADVQELIREVIQQTRLLRFEKADIARDLVNHFRDGHESGQSYEQLVRDFGTTEVAVSLFRSSKLRSRPVSVKAFRGSIAVFGGGVISYILLQIFFHAAKPNPTVDYSAKLNEEVTSMPEDQKAWPLYRELWTKYELCGNGDLVFEEFWVEETDADSPEIEWTDHQTHRRLIRPTDADWDRAVQKLESISDLLATLREGSRRPFVGVSLHSDRGSYPDEDLAALFPGWSRDELAKEKSVVDSFGLNVDPISKDADKLLSGSTTGILLPHIQQFRRLARIIRVDTRYAVQQGDQQRIIDNVNTIMRLGKQAGNNPIIVCSLVGVAIRGLGMNVVEELVTEHRDSLSDETLAELQSAVAELNFDAAYNPAGEKNFTLDLIQRIYSDDGDGDGRMTAVGAEVLTVLKAMYGGMSHKEPAWHESSFVRKATGPIQLFSAPSRKQLEALVEEVNAAVVENLGTRMWEESVLPDPKSIEERDPTGLVASPLLFMGNLKQSREVSIARQDSVLLAVAMHRYKRDNNMWPTSLDQLTGKWIDRTPIDRLSGKPLSFTIKNDQPVIYSLGHDGDDDGGDVKELSSPAWMDSEVDGDWVLWPTQD